MSSILKFQTLLGMYNFTGISDINSKLSDSKTRLFDFE